MIDAKNNLYAGFGLIHARLVFKVSRSSPRGVNSMKIEREGTRQRGRGLMWEAQRVLPEGGVALRRDKGGNMYLVKGRLKAAFVFVLRMSL